MLGLKNNQGRLKSLPYLFLKAEGDREDKGDKGDKGAEEAEGAEEAGETGVGFLH